MTLELEQAAAPAAAPGALLVKARNELGMTVEDVAEELRLSPRQIVALEQDDYSRLPGKTYVRGYLRNYARLVGLPVEQVVPAVPSAAPSQPAEEAAAVSPRGDRQVKSSDRHVRMVSYLLAGVLAGLLVLWWQGREEPPLETLDGRTPAAAVDGITEVLPGATDPAAGNAIPALPPLPAPVADVTRSDQETVTGPQTGEPAATSTDPDGAEAEQVVELQEDATTPVIRRADSSTAPPAGQSRMILIYSGNSWTEIRDARGKRLVYDTVPAGTTLYLDGVAPFQVYFANANAIRIQLNGKPYDFSSRVRRGFARFELGDPATGR